MAHSNPDVTPVSGSTIKCMQVNLGRGRVASQECLNEALRGGFSVLLLQEPFVGKRGYAKMGSYKIIQAYRNDKPVKSAIVLVNDKLTVAEYPTMCTENITCLTVVLGRHRLGLVSVYLEGTEDIGPYLIHIQRAVEEMRTPEVILAGDVNAKSYWWGESGEDSRGEAYVELLAQLNMSVLNKGHTATFSAYRNNRAYESIVDVTAATNTLLPKMQNWKVNPDLVTSSDHRAITFEVATSALEGATLRQTTRLYNTKKADWEAFDDSLEQALQDRGVTFDRVSEIADTHELNQIVEDLTISVTRACVHSIPAVGFHKKKKLKWWTKEIIQQKVTVVRLRNRIRGANVRRKPFVVAEYLEALEAFKEAIENARTTSWKGFCTGQTNEVIWKQAYKSLTSVNRQADLLLEDGSGRALDPQRSAELLAATFFPSDDPNTDSQAQAKTREDVTDLMASLRRSDHNGGSRHVPFQETELDQVVRRIGIAKAPGDDGFTADICARAIRRSGPLFLAITNKCLEIGYFPKRWKTATIRVIPKPLKDNYMVPKAYRPIGLLPVFGKILEKMFTSRMVWHLGSQGSLSKLQYGFTPQVSTEDALYDAVTLIRKEVSNKNIVAVLSLDIEGAFDGAWWPGILNQLSRKNCPAELLLLVRSYLSERSVRLQYAGTTVERTTDQGCIQGSTCGPLMWNLVMDLLLEAAEGLEAHVQAFADDVLVVASASTMNSLNRQVNEALKMIAKWGTDNKMKFAAHKTQAVIITNKLKYDTPQFILQGTHIAIGKEIKVLGVTIDRKLTFKAHIMNACSKAVGIYQAVATATRTNWGLSPKLTRLLYTAVVEPIVLYASSVWSPATERKYIIKKLNSLTRKFGILIARTHRTASHSSVLTLARILPLDLRVREVAELYELKRGKPYPTLPGREVERRVSPFLLPHPAARRVRTHGVINSQEDLDGIGNTAPRAFTDGSKIEGRVGAAVTWWDDGREVTTCKITLAPYCSVYQAELMAIQRAVTMFGKVNADSINILSDSRSALEAIANPNSVNPIVSEIHRQMRTIEDAHRNIHLYWIKAHVGIAGNERADELAKDAALNKKTSPAYDRIPVSFLRHSLRQSTITTWDSRYQASSTGGITKMFFPNVRQAYTVLDKIGITNLHAQIFTGHGGFREYLHRFKIASSPICVCDSDMPETVTHILDECPRFAARRLDLGYKTGVLVNKNYADFIVDHDNRRAFLEFATHVARAAARANGCTTV